MPALGYLAEKNSTYECFFAKANRKLIEFNRLSKAHGTPEITR